MSCQVQVAQGVLQGKECKTFYGKKYYSFEGIPYAKPPVGKLRFQAPLPPENWTGIRDATKPGNKCCQLNPYNGTPMEGSEDCLYLNVYTPNLPHEKIQKLPVIFFVHGGRFIFGYGDYYKPDYLLKNDVILVTINYRLNILGFLCLNIPEVPGNGALKDSIMALRWVNKNITLFNGDVNNITAMGESAGAGIVSSYMATKMADGLFSKVICQSGVCIADLFMIESEDPIEKAKVIASNLGKHLTDPRSLYEFLVDVPIEDLVIAFTAAEMGRPPAIINCFMLPVIEKKFDNVEQYFEGCPRIDIAKHRLRKEVPCLIGMNSREAALFLQKDIEGNIIYEKDFFHMIPRYMPIKQGDRNCAEFDGKLREFYFKDRKVDDVVKNEYIDMISDRYFHFDIMQFAEHVSKVSKNVYFYQFHYPGGMNTRVMKSLGVEGACHGDLIQYQFYRKSKHEQGNDKDLQMVDMICEAWCNFAKNGKPTWGDGKTKWQPYTPTDKHTLILDNKTQIVKNPYAGRLKFWQNLTKDSNSKL